MGKINCDLINVSICLTDLEKKFLQKAENGKVYLNATITDRKEPDKFGNDLSIYYNQRKKNDGTRPAKAYVRGNIKSITFNTTEQPVFTDEPVIDDIPF